MSTYLVIARNPSIHSSRHLTRQKLRPKSIHIGDAILPESATKLTKTYCSEFGTLLWRHLTLQRTRSSADADNRLDAFSGQSRSTNMVRFHMLHIVSYCAIVTLSLRRYFLRYSSSKNFMTLKWGSKVT